MFRVRGGQGGRPEIPDKRVIMSWGDPDRVSRWQPGDKVMDVREARVRTIKTLANHMGFRVMHTTTGERVAGEDLDMWDLVLPELTWTGATYDERLAARAG